MVTNRIKRGEREYHSHLLRRSYREGGKVKKQTLANLSHLPPEAIAALRAVLAGKALLQADDAVTVVRTLPAGHVEAALAMAGRLDLARLLDRSPARQRSLCLAMVIERVLQPGSKLATARALSQSTLAAELGVEGADQDDLYGAMDWLLERQRRIEDRLARRHLEQGTLVLYDVTSSYFEGHTCPLLGRGYSRDGKRGTLQITYGLLCDPQGRPVAVEVFPGELHDDKTLPAQLEKLKARFKLGSVIVVSDRGMVTKANLEAMREADGVAWITALKAPQVQRLVRDDHLQPSLFDEQNLAEISDPEHYPSERLVVCRNPLVAVERARKREDLLQATESGLEQIRARVVAGTLRGAAEIGLAVGPALRRYRVKKHFEVEITDASFDFARKQAEIEAEAALDGIYVLRTSVAESDLDGPAVVGSYKLLKEAERAFRTLKGPLEVRPVHHRLEERVRAHVFLCMLAYYLEWHLRQAWAELIFTDEQPPERADPVAKAARSAAAERKARSKRTSSGEPCHSLRSLLDELSLRARNTIRIEGAEATFERLTEPTRLQARALQLAREAPVIA